MRSFQVSFGAALFAAAVLTPMSASAQMTNTEAVFDGEAPVFFQQSEPTIELVDEDSDIVEGVVVDGVVMPETVEWVAPRRGLVGQGVLSSVEPADFRLITSRRVTVTFVSESATHRNAFGWYAIAEDGQIMNPEIIWADASDTESGGQLQSEISIVELGWIPENTRIGFFLVSNGFLRDASTLGREDLDEGIFEFRNEQGGQATIFDIAPALVYIDSDTNETTIGSPVFHSSADPDSLRNLQLNSDRRIHVHFASDRENESRVLVQFEDIEQQGDADFDDLIVAIEF